MRLGFGLPVLLLLWSAIAATATADDGKFRQLEEILPTPGATRTASGAPGPGYWQQRADYTIEVRLDDAKQRIEGSETIRYANNSPDQLEYLWLQLDQNRFSPDSADRLSDTVAETDKMSYEALRQALARANFAGGHEILAVRDAEGRDLRHAVNDTMMRIDLPAPLAPGAAIQFSIDWRYNIPDARALRSRGGYEYFPDDKNYLYGIAQWFPRMVVYGDQGGWQHKQFLGRGEFTLEFGDYEVAITVPADHVVAATGQLQNPDEVLTQTQQARLAEARTATKPVLIITPEEAKANEKSRAKQSRTWRFAAKNVRDFAFASSRKLIWDAMGHAQPGDGGTVMAMSFYPNEGNPLWAQYSTKALIHSLNVYSRFSFPYPYPLIQSINGPVRSGMEYPMLAFNGPRPETGKDGKRTYGRNTKYSLISVIIHEAGHNYFPMIVNSDERQWTWMDEGLNTFLQYLSEQEWEADYPSRRGPPSKIASYMASADQVPIMTSSDELHQFGNNAYGKPATALNVLRETVLGRDLFDFAFKTYATRWMFKRPYPADFFRTMEDASGTDLDWFWRGWFYSTDHVDIALDKVTRARIDTKNPAVERPWEKQREQQDGPDISTLRNRDLPKAIEGDPDLKDFYNRHDEYEVTPTDTSSYQTLVNGLEYWEKQLLATGEDVYFLEFTNKGGLVMPLILKVEYRGREPEIIRVPAEIWRMDTTRAVKAIVTKDEIVAITVDPYWETADTDMSDNHWPRRAEPSRLELFKLEKERDMMRELEDAKTNGDKPKK